jgi:peptide/nickel transport system substrate-binding protein
MSDQKEHVYIPELKEQLRKGEIDRREFLRTATLLGMAAPAAYAFANTVSGGPVVKQALAEDTPKMGGTLRMGMAVQEMADPPTYDWGPKANLARQFLEYVTMTGPDNVTRPFLAESWEASDDLKTWTFKLREGVNWTNGDTLSSDQVIWNVKRWLDPNTGSSIQGLLKALTTEDAEGKVKEAEGAVEKIDDMTFRLNLNKPELAIPEAFYHYPAPIVHPDSMDDNGVVDVSKRPIGTGPFKLQDYSIGNKASVVRNPDFWGGPDYVAGGPYLDSITFTDLGDDPAAQIAAIASDQVDLLEQMDVSQIDVAEKVPGIKIWDVVTAQTAIARMQMDVEPYTNKALRRAAQACIDHDRLLELAHRGLGAPAEDHHVAPIHPEYAELPKIVQDHEKAKKLLAEAGYPDGATIKMDVNNNQPWEVAAAQAMVAMMEPAGIKLELNIMPGAQFWDIWDKTPFGLTSWTHRPLGVMVYNLAYRTGAIWNESHFSDPTFDEALDKAGGILDARERSKPMAIAEKTLQDSGVIIQTLWRSIVTAGRDNIQNFHLHPTNYLQMYRVWLA